MTSRLNPYINFDGTAREALTFYQQVFGGDLVISTFGEYGMAGTPDEHKVMHGQLESPAGFTLMASDAPTGMPRDSGSSISISLSGDDGADLRRYWAGLCGGGTVTVPMEAQAWGDEFGMCVDRFGVAWMVNVAQSHG